MLKLKDIVFHFPDFSIQCHLEIPQGSRVALKGPSGSGKSTLLDMIAGFLKPASGDILWENRSLITLSVAERPISYLLQSHNIFDHLNVQENILLGLYSLEKPQRNIMEKELPSLTQAMELETLAQQKTAQLSGGQKQRVALARILMQGQPLWLLDEPFNGLDLTMRTKLYDILKEWQTRLQATILFTSHHENEIRSFATHCSEMVQSSNQSKISHLNPVIEGISF